MNDKKLKGRVKQIYKYEFIYVLTANFTKLHLNHIKKHSLFFLHFPCHHHHHFFYHPNIPFTKLISFCKSFLSWNYHFYHNPSPFFLSFFLYVYWSKIICGFSLVSRVCSIKLSSFVLVFQIHKILSWFGWGFVWATK